MRVSATEMTASESATVAQLKARTLLLSSQGRLTGGTITPGSTVGTVNIAAVSGMTSVGEIAQISVATANQALADGTNGVANYVCLIYAEAFGTPVAHETSGTTSNTVASSNARLVVVTLAQLNAMPATSTTQTVNALDRMIMLGRVTAQGLGVAIPLSAISQSPNALEMRQCTWFGSAIPGLLLGQMSPNATLGLATLTYSASGDSLTLQLFGEGSAGTAVTPVRTTNSVTVTSLNGYTLTLGVIGDLLPLSGTPALSLTVGAMWAAPSGTSTTPGSATDQRLRGTTSSIGARSSTNPLGLSLDGMVNESGLSLPFRGLLDIGSALIGSTANAMFPRLNLRTRSGSWTCLAKWRGTGTTPTAIYWRLWNTDTAGYVATYNADFDGTNFNRDTNGAVAQWFGILPAGFSYRTFDATSTAAWLLADWVAKINTTTASTTFSGNMITNGTGLIIGALTALSSATIATTLDVGTSATVNTSLSVGTTATVGSSLVVSNAPVGDPLANGLYSWNIPKAYARIDTDGASGYTITNAFNIDTTASFPTNDQLKLTFLTDFADTGYIMVSGLVLSGSNPIGPVVGVYSRNLSDCIIKAIDFTGTPLNIKTGAFPASMQVAFFGKQ